MSGRYAPTDKSAPAVPTGDTFLDRVNMKEARETLPPGTLALSVNKRLRRRRAETRHGIYPPTFANVLNLTLIRGWGIFARPGTEPSKEILLVAGNTAVYVHRDGMYPLTIPVEGEMAAAVEFVQANDKIFLFQGPDKKQLVWDGLSPDGFKEITKSHPLDTSTDLIPPLTTAEPTANRLLFIVDNDIARTDIADYTSYDPILARFPIGVPIVRVFDYVKGIAIAFCRRTIALLINYTTADPAQVAVETVNSKQGLGLVGRKACVMDGGDALFLSEPGGIYRLTQSFESRQQVLPLPLSDPIQPLIDRINWRNAAGAVAIASGEYIKFAVPIDGATANNAIINYNGATGLMEGYDIFPEGKFQIDDLLVTYYQGERRLFALDKKAARIYVLDEGKSDFIYVPNLAAANAEDDDEPEVPRLALREFPIADVMETRGYETDVWNSDGTRTRPNAGFRRDFTKVSIAISSWAPSIMVTELSESASDERPLNETPITKDRVVYDRFGKFDWNPTNENDDWAAPGRQDYSVTANDVGVVFSEKNGIDFDRHQASALRFSTKARGRFMSYRIANTGGACDVSAVLVESNATQREPRRAG